MKEEIGKRVWAIGGSNIPLEQSGEEPAFTSHDSLWMLNANEEEATVEITVYFEDRDPYGPYEIEIEGQRVRQVRFNDLIDPAAIPLEVDYGAVVVSSVPIVVQFSQMDTRQAANTRTFSGGFPVR